jgi:hypothetical protein
MIPMVALPSGYDEALQAREGRAPASGNWCPRPGAHLRRRCRPQPTTDQRPPGTTTFEHVTFHAGEATSRATEVIGQGLWSAPDRICHPRIAIHVSERVFLPVPRGRRSARMATMVVFPFGQSEPPTTRMGRRQPAASGAPAQCPWPRLEVGHSQWPAGVTGATTSESAPSQSEVNVSCIGTPVGRLWPTHGISHVLGASATPTECLREQRRSSGRTGRWWRPM